MHKNDTAPQQHTVIVSCCIVSMNNSVADQNLHALPDIKVSRRHGAPRRCSNVGPGKKPTMLHNNIASHGTTHVQKPIPAEQYGTSIQFNAARCKLAQYPCRSLWHSAHPDPAQHSAQSQQYHSTSPYISCLFLAQTLRTATAVPVVLCCLTVGNVAPSQLLLHLVLAA